MRNAPDARRSARIRRSLGWGGAGNGRLRAWNCSSFNVRAELSEPGGCTRFVGVVRMLSPVSKELLLSISRGNSGASAGAPMRWVRWRQEEAR